MPVPEPSDLLPGTLDLLVPPLADSPANSRLTAAGANSAMFGIIDVLLFRPPPRVRDPDRSRAVGEGEKRARRC